MPGNWFTTTDAGLLTFAEDMSAKITATPTAFGLVAGDATTLAGFVTSYSTNYNLAKDPATRSKITIEQKDQAKALLIADIRVLGRRIQANPSVTNAQKLSLG